MRTTHGPDRDLRRARCGDDSHGGFGSAVRGNGLAGRPVPHPGPTSHLAGMTDTLIADADGVYHPAVFNDRLVRHEVLRDRTEVKDHRRRAVAVVR